MHPISFTTALESDSDWVSELKRKIGAQYCADVFGWDEQQQNQLQQWPLGKPILISCQSQRLGSYALVTTAYGYHLSEFYILPEYQRQGIGSRVLCQLVKQWDAEVAECRLSVLQGNPVVSLFRRFGFTSYASDANCIYMRRRASRAYPFNCETLCCPAEAMVVQ